MRRSQHSQGWHELQQLSQQTHVQSKISVGLARVGHAILITLGFLSLIGIVAFFE